MSWTENSVLGVAVVITETKRGANFEKNRDRTLDARGRSTVASIVMKKKADV